MLVIKGLQNLFIILPQPSLPLSFQHHKDEEFNAAAFQAHPEQCSVPNEYLKYLQNKLIQISNTEKVTLKIFILSILPNLKNSNLRKKFQES